MYVFPPGLAAAAGEAGAPRGGGEAHAGAPPRVPSYTVYGDHTNPPPPPQIRFKSI